MVAKRALFPAGPYPLAKRVKRLERRQASRKPEMHNTTFSMTSAGVATNTLTYNDITNLDQGTLNYQRLGAKVKVWRIEVRGYIQQGLDFYVVQSHSDETPAKADWNSVKGGFITPDKLNTKLTEWLYTTMYTGGGSAATVPNVGNFRKVVKFPRGITVRYAGTDGTQIIDNRLFMCVKNDSGVAQAYDISCKVWFTDA